MRYDKPARAEDASLLRALATDVEQDPEYAYGNLTAGMLRRIAVRLMESCEYEAESVVREMVRRTGDNGGTDIAFVSASTGDDVTTVRVSPQIAARIMAYIENELAGAQSTSNRVA